MQNRLQVHVRHGLAAMAVLLGVGIFAAVSPALAQDQKPNILFIMGDDIGWMQPSIYHRRLMVGEPPTVARRAREGGFSRPFPPDQAPPPGGTPFSTGIHPLPPGMTPPQLPGSPSYLQPGTPALAWFLRDLGYNTGEFG